MRDELVAVIADLKRRKAEGEASVYLSDDTLEALKSAVSATTHETVPQREEAPQARQVEAAVEHAAPTIAEIAPRVVPVATAPAEPEERKLPPPPVVELPVGTKQEQWAWLRDKVLNCPECNSHVKSGKKVVFGVGNIDSPIFFCGEAPGADEEIQGEPFVGKAGQLLTRIIQAMGLQRSDVYIGNIMNWRPELPTPTGNRPPTQEEMTFCLPYLKAQIEIVKPQVIVALGNTAISGLLGPDSSRRLGKIRGTWHEFNGIALMPTYHPSYVLQYGSNKTKRQIWEDMLTVMERVGLPISEKQRGFFA